MRLIETFILKGVILDTAKMLPFLLPILAVAHQQLILGSDLNLLFNFGTGNHCIDCLGVRSNLVCSHIVYTFPFQDFLMLMAMTIASRWSRLFLYCF